MKKKYIAMLFIILPLITFDGIIQNTIYFTPLPTNSRIERPHLRLSPKIFDWDFYITQSVGKTPLSIAIGDVNNDGELDIVTANNNSGTITILLWNITQNNWTYQTISSGIGTCDVITGDVNNDGLVDIVTVNNLSNNINILIWNDTLQSWNSEIQPVGNRPSAVAIGDANNNGLNEIIVSNFNDNTISILNWNHTKRIWNITSLHITGNGPSDVDIGDANYDGLQEIVTANKLSNDVSIILWNETERKWENMTSQSVGNNPVAIKIEDGNNDGQLDIITANRGGDSITLLTWNLSNRIWDIKNRAVGRGPIAISIGDINYDGKKEIIIANYDDSTISILIWNSSINNWDITIKNVGASPTSIAIGDINTDGLIEVINTNSLDNTISIFLWNTTKGGLISTTYLACINPSDIAVGDVNNDGAQDLVVATSNNNTIAVFCWNKSLKNWNPKITLKVEWAPTSIAIGDVNNDGAFDIVTCSKDSASHNVSIVIWNKLTKTWNPYITRTISIVGAWDIKVADANNDGANDIIVANPEHARISILIWNKTQRDWNSYINITGIGIPYYVEVDDINNDGFNDLLASGNGTARYVWYHLWNCSKKLWESYKVFFYDDTKKYRTPITVDDVNNDGFNDIVLANTLDNDISIYIWNPKNQSWIYRGNQYVMGLPTAIGVGDVNNDGQKDIITANAVTQKISIFYWNVTKQNWEAQVNYMIGNDPRSIIIKDVTCDGMTDIVVANYQDNNLSFIIFNRYPLILAKSSIQTNSIWTQNEDFGSFSINFTNYGIDFEDKNLRWALFDLNTTLIDVDKFISSEAYFTFYSKPNKSGTDKFWMVLFDSHNCEDKVEITITINEVNDPPLILFKNQLKNNLIWKQSLEVEIFSINLTPYEFDVEDKNSELKWFVKGLDPTIATVTGENSSNHVLIFHLKNIGTDEFSLILMDSDGATDTLQLTITVESLNSLLIIVSSVIVGGITILFFVLHRKKKYKSQNQQIKKSKPLQT